jgi:hypothetical protein
MAPSDDYFVRDAQQPRPQGGKSEGGQGGAGGELAGPAGAGGVETSGGADGESGGAALGGESPGGAGGERSGCGEDFVEDAGTCVSISGCSDGTREGFLPVSAWPNLAGCTARWPRASLRDAKTGVPCGFEEEACAVPADACGDGWHICASPPYAPTEISNQATAEECAAQPGAYVAAVGDQFCEPCSDVGDGAACCGDRCIQQNGNCIYPGQTAWFGVYNGHKNVCGAIESDLVQRGVLCCRGG